jgi:hypothetical protein
MNKEEFRSISGLRMNSFWQMQNIKRYQPEAFEFDERC